MEENTEHPVEKWVREGLAKQAEQEAMFPFTYDDMKASLLQDIADRENQKKHSREICRCGHGARSHTDHGTTETHRILREAGRNGCYPARQRCPCTKFEGVMRTDDPRKFVFKTEGPAERHALAKGAMSRWAKEGVAEWLPGVVCDGCKQGGIQLIPLPMDGKYREMREPTAVNLLMCANCRAKLAATHIVVVE